MELPTAIRAAALPSFLLLCLATSAVLQALAQPTSGFISIDCGFPGETGYIPDDGTMLSYSTDAGFLDAHAGSNHNVTAEYIYSFPSQRRWWHTLRSFPSRVRNCYTLGSLVARRKYLIRAMFLYGNYDGLNRLPTFDLYVGVNFWRTVTISKLDDWKYIEVIMVVPHDSVQVCLVNTGNGVPFISGLVLRPLKNKMYPLANATQALVLLHRINLGPTGAAYVGYPDDPYDRLWFMFISTPWATISTKMKVEIGDDIFQPPKAFMQTAVMAQNVSNNIDFTLDLQETPGSNHSLGYADVTYFSELQQLPSNALREFNVYRNDEEIGIAYTPPYLVDSYLFASQAFQATQYRVTLTATTNSTLPPILNAIELFSVIPTTTVGTDSRDASAITAIKGMYQVHKNWMGDPCVPKTLVWDGLNCTYANNQPPIISNVNVSFSGLNGAISPNFANLKDVKHLDLSNNNLIGSIPDTLSQLPSLTFLDLSNNKLNGSIPYGLLKKHQVGTLDLRYGNNPDLCSKGNSCQLAERDNKQAIHIVVPLVVIVVLVLLAMLCFWLQRRRKQAISICIWRKRSSLNKTALSYTACSEDIEDIKSLLLDPSVIRIATGNFSDENKLGEGGFGQVYKGMMPDGQEIAVKRLSKESKQGIHELKNELLLIAKLQHRNLVKLIGACLDGEDKLLVYEYIPKKSLDAFIFDEEKRKQLAWDTRYKIICGIARGLVYLHDESRIKVIHRDLKPSNILLEMDMNPKISDFGLASVFEADCTKHITRRVAGTYGYMAPEYAVLGHVSTKSDVFSFGMIILEIVTGRRNSVSSETMMAEHLLTYVWENWTRGTKAEIVDPSLHYNCSESEVVIKCVHIGLLCVQEDPSDRPGMSNVILMLLGKSTTLPAPSRPAFLFRLNHENHVHGGLSNLLDDSKKSNQSFNELTITELEPR